MILNMLVRPIVEPDGRVLTGHVHGTCEDESVVLQLVVLTEVGVQTARRRCVHVVQLARDCTPPHTLTRQSQTADFAPGLQLAGSVYDDSVKRRE